MHTASTLQVARCATTTLVETGEQSSCTLLPTTRPEVGDVVEVVARVRAPRSLCGGRAAGASRHTSWRGLVFSPLNGLEGLRITKSRLREV